MRRSWGRGCSSCCVQGTARRLEPRKPGEAEERRPERWRMGVRAKISDSAVSEFGRHWATLRSGMI